MFRTKSAQAEGSVVRGQKWALRVAIPAVLLIGGGVLVLAQAPQTTPQNADETPEASFKTSTFNIIAPTLVTDRSGNIIDGLQGHQFHLYDNKKEQDIHVDVSFLPISMVVAVEASTRIDGPILNQIKKLGTLIPEVAGDHGEVAVMAVDSRLRVMQDFTSDTDKIKAAIDKITAGNSSNRIIDAVDQSVYMLRHRPKENRKIVLLVSETRDQASEGRLKQTLIDANFANVVVYTVDISQLMVRLTEKAPTPRPNPIDITSNQTFAGQPPTPTNQAQNYGPNQVQFLPVLTEIYKETKRIFVDSTTEAMAKGTGGAEFSFVKQKGLEDAIQRISTEIRSQYLITYAPNNKGDPGFHTIVVGVDNPRYEAKTRPGYWVGGGQQ
jgi:VWFA-related protein